MIGSLYAKGIVWLAAAALLLACDSESGSSGAADTPVTSEDTGGGGAIAEPDAAPSDDLGPGAPDAPGPGPQPQITEACPGTMLLERPEDPGARGPWPVGVRTVEIEGIVTEVWYPAVPGSEEGASKVLYDLRDQLPPGEGEKIPDDENPFQECDCYRDLPVDDTLGPYPIVVFVHGTAGFRTQTLTQMHHWASRGFVVACADNKGIQLVDALTFNFGADQPGDAAAVLDALSAPSGELAFLDGLVDTTRVGMSGHSAGGGAIKAFGNRAQVLMPLASGGVDPGSQLALGVVMGGLEDGIVPWDNTVAGFEASPSPKALIGLDKAGHLSFSDICFLGRERGGILQIALDNGVDVNPLVAGLATDGCAEDQIAPERAWEIVNYATAAALESVLHCSEGASAKLDAVRDLFPEVTAFERE